MGTGIGVGVERTGRHRTLYLPIFSRDGLGKRVQEILDSRVMSWLGLHLRFSIYDNKKKKKAIPYSLRLFGLRLHK